MLYIKLKHLKDDDTWVVLLTGLCCISVPATLLESHVSHPRGPDAPHNGPQVSTVTARRLPLCLQRAASSKPSTKPRAAAVTVIRSSLYLFYTNYLHMFGSALPSRLRHFPLLSVPEEGEREDSWQRDRSVFVCSDSTGGSHFPSTPHSEVQMRGEISSRDSHVQCAIDSWPVCDHTFRSKLMSNQK